MNSKIKDKQRPKNEYDFKNKSILQIMWEQNAAPVNGMNFKAGFVSSFMPKDPKKYLEAFEKGDFKKINELPINIIEAYHGSMPKIYFSGTGTVKSLEVAISSTQTEDESLLNNLYRKTLSQS
ncbi:MAG: hypothetical protein PHU27_07740 [Salinivirgaceae bacterium]|nr:hypothetical protein [Salinivirgaceae bacterium]